MKTEDDFNIENLRIPAEEAELRLRAVTPHKVRKRREHFVQIPFVWVERLNGVSGKGCILAMHLAYLHWRNKGRPFTLANGMLKNDGISRASKWRALAELESRGLITIERRPSKSPIITVNEVSQI